MKVTPKTAEEIEKEQVSRGPLRPGIYDFEVLEAEDKVSKSDNEMIAIEIKVFDGEGGYRKVKDWLLDSMAYKVRHFCETAGLLKEYEAGKFEAFDCLNRGGKVKIGIEKSKDPQYKDRNRVVDYVKSDEAVAMTRSAPARKPAMAGADDPFGDEIPF
jgi:hypothetical protein